MLIIGCGNRDRGDDGAGILVAERLRELGIEANTRSGEAVDLIEAWKSADDVIVVDAVVTGAPVARCRHGTVGSRWLPSAQLLRPMALAWQKPSNWLRFWIAFQCDSGSMESRDGDSNPGPRFLPKYSVLSRKWCEESSPT